MSGKRRWLWALAIVAVALAVTRPWRKFQIGCSFGPRTLYEAFNSHRNMGRTNPIDHNEHLRMVGTATFIMGDQTITQDAELLLAGPSRMRFELEQDGARNVFAFDGEDAWLLTPGAETWGQHDSGLLWSETLLRWEAARFPQGWKEVLDASPSSASFVGEERPFERSMAEGLLTVIVGWDSVDGASPTRIEFKPASERADLVAASVVLEEWVTIPLNRTRQPARMIWHDGQRIEEWTSILDGAFFLDSSFRPPEQGRSSHSVSRPDLAENVRDLGNRIDVGERTWWWMSEDRYLDYAQRDRLRGRWWTVDGERRIVLTTSPDGDEQVDIESGRWLTWSRYAIDTWTPNEDVLVQALKQADVVEDGPRWRVEVRQDGRRRLHMLRIRVRDAD